MLAAPPSLNGGQLPAFSTPGHEAGKQASRSNCTAHPSPAAKGEWRAPVPPTVTPGPARELAHNTTSGHRHPPPSRGRTVGEQPAEGDGEGRRHDE